MSKHNIADIYSLSPLQQGMLFHTLYDPASGAYHQQLVCTLEGALDLSAFKRAWRQVVERHAVLRTFFTWQRRDRPLQVVRQRVELPWQQQDWCGLVSVEQSERLEQFLQADRELGFDLSTAPLMRLALFQVDAKRFYFVWSHHHLLLDGWSLPIVLREVFACYEAFCHGRPVQLEPPRAYRDYILWLQRQDLAQAERFWRETLRGFAAPTPLRVERQTAGGSQVRPENPYKQYRRLSPEMTGRLRSLAREHQLTLNTLVQGAWALLLSRYSGEPEVVYGTTVSGRPVNLPGVAGMVGLFINTLPVRVRISPRASLLPWLEQLQAHQMEIRQYEYTPLAEVQRWSEVPGGTPLFDHILVFENYPLDASLRQGVGDLRIDEVRFVEKTNYALGVMAAAETDLSLSVSYDCQRFDSSVIARMLAHWQTLLEGIVARPEQCLSDLPLLTQAERHQLLVAWNETEAVYPEDASIHELFEAQAKKTPDAVAVIIPSIGFAQHPGASGRVQRAPAPVEQTGHRQDQYLTYRELNRRANQLAHHLRGLGVGPEVLVGLCVERSVEMVVGLLGILKAGGAYVPLDPEYPQERLALMLNDARAPLLLTQAHLLERLPTFLRSYVPKTICLDADWGVIAKESAENPCSGVTADNLAYVIYTSGSTGRPKGVLLAHRGLSNVSSAQIQTFALNPSDCVLQFASLSFDASIFEICMALRTGAALCLGTRASLLPGPGLVRFLQDHQVTIATLTPSALAALPFEDLPNLRIINVAGEACSVELVTRWGEGRRFFNLYGPTEGTIWTMAAECDADGSPPPIGRPIANTHVYILDPHLQPLPVGVPGELCIGGVGLARGYLNRSELTAEKFIPIPSLTAPLREGMPTEQDGGERLYRTGDLARYLPDGNIEFLGRTDHQVKIRGFRIELGEIEAVLGAHPTVRGTAVLAREYGAQDRRLVVYVVPNDERRAPAQEQVGSMTGDEASAHRLSRFVSDLRGYLREKLPDYMLPSAFVTLETLPLTVNGKLDREALSALEHVHPALEATLVAPRTPTEEKLAGIWAKVLGLEQIGVHDSFFDLGGHSLLATQVVSRVSATFRVEISLPDFFQAPTVAGLAQAIENGLRAETSHASTIISSEDFEEERL